MLHHRDTATDVTAFDSGYDEGYRVGFFERRSPQSMLPDDVPERFNESYSHKSYVQGWQEGYFKGSRSREINR